MTNELLRQTIFYIYIQRTMLTKEEEINGFFMLEEKEVKKRTILKNYFLFDLQKFKISSASLKV